MCIIGGRKKPWACQTLILTEDVCSRAEHAAIKKQLILSTMDCKYYSWRSATHTHATKLQFLQSKRLRSLINTSFVVGNR